MQPALVVGLLLGRTRPVSERERPAAALGIASKVAQPKGRGGQVRLDRAHQAPRTEFKVAQVKRQRAEDLVHCFLGSSTEYFGSVQ